MSSTDRQNRLFIAEDWKRVYQSYKNADFSSYDFENLRRVMINYLRENYPEDFNDYIESSEYLALIDMVAFLGQSFAFRVDLNARENFLELAERRESILRLARTLGYNAKRNKAANGLLKWESITTTENVIDGNGRNISNTEIVWNDPSNPNWLEQFTKIVNAALPITAQFGSPENKQKIYNIETEQYRLQTLNSSVPIFTFTKLVDGRNMNFEVVSTIIDQNNIVEDPPLAGKRMAFLYKDDGKGAASFSNGFFSLFKQGALNTGIFNLSQSVPNELIDIDTININENDLWLYKMDSAGLEVEYWQKVPNLKSNNIIYNSLNKSIKNIYNVITRANDRVSLVFGDGVFSNIPIGSFRVYYRVSNGLRYTINPKDMKNVSLSLAYVSNTGQLETLGITMSLQSSIDNSSEAETNDQIKSLAPAMYYTQDRMITGEDYNISPLSVSQDILKIKAVNRSSSGISRYFDLIDPTGKYSTIDLFSDDGIIYREEYEDILKFSYKNRIEIQATLLNDILPILSSNHIQNYYYLKFPRTKVSTDTLTTLRWVSQTQASNLSTGYITNINDDHQDIEAIGALKYLKAGALIKFAAPFGKRFDLSKNNKLELSVKANTSEYIWAKVISYNKGYDGVRPNGTGEIVLNIRVPSNAILSEIIPRYTNTLDQKNLNIMNDLIFSNKNFGLRYNLDIESWDIIYETNLNLIDNFSNSQTGDISNQKLDSSWIIVFTTDTINYTVRSRNLRYVFESEKKIRFYIDKRNKIFDIKNNKVVKDKIVLLSINAKPNTNEQESNTIKGLNYDMDWEIYNNFIGNDGYVDNKKIEINFNDSNDDGVVDDPDIFDILVGPKLTSLQNLDRINLDAFIILRRYETLTGQFDYEYVYNRDINGELLVTILEKLNDLPSISVNNKYYYVYQINTLFKYSEVLSKYNVSLDYKVFVGRDKLKFQFVHSADFDVRIDPGFGNLIDLYVLTKEYDILYRQWLLGSLVDEPLPSSTTNLSLLLEPELSKIKAISDEIIYHPVKYKLLFGAKAESSLRAIFKIVKNKEQSISDNDIKSRVLIAINEFFNIDNWNFGDSFYFSEISAYIMARTAPFLVNILIVPRSQDLNFGSLFEIRAESDQLFLSAATADDIEVIEYITAGNINNNLQELDSSIVSRQSILSS